MSKTGIAIVSFVDQTPAVHGSWSLVGGADLNTCIVPDTNVNLIADLVTYISKTGVGSTSFTVDCKLGDVFRIPAAAVITQVSYFVRAAAVSVIDTPELFARLNGVNYGTAFTGINSATNISNGQKDFNLNPETGLAWTVSDLNNDEFGLGYTQGGGGLGTMYVDQFWLRVAYTSAGMTLTPDTGPIAGGTPVTFTGGSGQFAGTVLPFFGGGTVATNIAIPTPSSLTFDTPAMPVGLQDFGILVLANALNYRKSVTYSMSGADGFLFTDAPATDIRLSQLVLEGIWDFDVFLQGLGEPPPGPPTPPPQPPPGPPDPPEEPPKQPPDPPAPVCTVNNACSNLGSPEAAGGGSGCSIDSGKPEDDGGCP